MPQLGTMTKERIKKVWDDERAFASWLANNLPILNELLSVSFEHPKEQVSVGRFKADIVCTNVSTTNRPALAVIEVQLGQSDHDHLGKVITYAAGLDDSDRDNKHVVSHVVWIAEDFTDEHSKALNWFNEKEDSSVRYYGLEVALWQIDDSRLAPKIDVVVKPSRIQGTVNEQEAENVRYWNEFEKQFNIDEVDLTFREVRKWHFLDFSIREGARAVLSVARLKSEVQVRLVLATETQSTYFSELLKQQRDIERELDVPLVWDDGGARSVIRTTMTADPSDETEWTNQFEWIGTNLVKFHNVLRARVNEITVARGLSRS